ncbi:hypothetical protein Taro_026537 [Colocasia esculenta]|uniref:Uncharacterized protein n=1 Tax=Colocasia esculenta TaxID=4460 RepID=A0A843VRL2_COLES|nr:hypothetical protein [Colocasia esculenta]
MVRLLSDALDTGTLVAGCGGKACLVLWPCTPGVTPWDVQYGGKALSTLVQGNPHWSKVNQGASGWFQPVQVNQVIHQKGHNTGVPDAELYPREEFVFCSVLTLFSLNFQAWARLFTGPPIAVATVLPLLGSLVMRFLLQ